MAITQNRPITEDEIFPIQPEHIDTERHMYGAFGSMETETSAHWLVSFVQTRGQGWKPFTYAEINSHYRLVGKFLHDYTFNNLFWPKHEKPFIVREEVKRKDPSRIEDADVFRFTHEFVTRCYLANGRPHPRVVKTFVELFYPGTLFSETRIEEVTSREPAQIAEQHKKAFAFQFFDQERRTFTVDGKATEVAGPKRNLSPSYYPGGTVYTLDELKQLKTGDFGILISNMQGNGYCKVVKTRRGNYQPFERAEGRSGDPINAVIL